MADIQEMDALPSLDARFPCRQSQLRQLQTLFSPSFPAPSNLVVHGLGATGKSTITKSVLEEADVPHAIVASRECITTRHLLEQAATKCWNAVRSSHGSSNGTVSQPRCDSVNSLANHLEKLLALVPKFVLVFDGIDRQKEATPILFPGLARLGDTIKSLTVVFIISVASPRLFHHSGLPHIYFPPYSKDEMIEILSLSPPKIFIKPVDASYDYGDEEEAEDRRWLWPRYCTAVYDTLGKAAARDLKSLRDVCNKLWRPFVQPIVDGSFGTRDFTKLLVSRKAIFQQEHVLSGNYFNQKNSHLAVNVSKRSGMEDLPYHAKFVLCAAYLASYNPARQDSIYFMKSTDKRRRRRNTGARKPAKHRKISRHLLSPSPFSLDRLSAILHSLLPRTLSSNAQILAQIATLTSLRLLIRPGSANIDTLDPASRFKVNCSWEYVASLGRSVGLEVRDYLAS